jgi:outer membrane lipoprotein-sorting protein
VLLIDQKIADIAGIKIENSTSEIIFYLDEMEHNVQASAEQFTFEPPEGVTVIRDTGTGFE